MQDRLASMGRRGGCSIRDSIYKCVVLDATAGEMVESSLCHNDRFSDISSSGS